MPKQNIKNTKNLESYTVRIQNPRNIYSLYTEEFSQLTAANIKVYTEAARKGLNFYKALLFEEIRKRDLHIGGICQSRKLAVIGKKWQIKGDSFEEGVDFINNIFKNINFNNFLSNIIEANFQGVSLFEINYKEDKGKINLESIIRIPNYLYLYDDIADEYKILDITRADGLELRMSASMSGLTDRIDIGRIPKIELNPLKILEVESSDCENVNGFRNGFIDALIWGYMLKSYGLKDYSVYLELFGNPMRVGKYDPLNISKKSNDSFLEAVRDMGNLAYAVIPNTYTIEFPSDTNKGTTAGLFKDYIDYLDNAMSIRVLGQTLTTKLSSQGSYAAASIHDIVRKDIMEADMNLISDAVNVLITRIIDINFANIPEYPVFEFGDEIAIDYKKTRIEILKTISDMGFKINPEKIENEFDVEMVQQSSEVEPAAPMTGKVDNYAEKKKKLIVTDEEIKEFLKEIFNNN